MLLPKRSVFYVKKVFWVRKISLDCIVNGLEDSEIRNLRVKYDPF